MVTAIGCMRPKCCGIAIYRGCCIRHYNQVKGRVARKLTTWAEAEQQGLVKPFIRGKNGLLNGQKEALRQRTV
jgi:phage gp36-like protein